MNPYDPPQSPNVQPTIAPPKDGKAVAALVLGCVSLVAWCVPIVGLPVSVIGIILGAIASKGPKRGIAIVGLAMCGLGLLATLANAALTFYIISQGQHPLLK